jgi:hypothetical protein
MRSRLGTLEAISPQDRNSKKRTLNELLIFFILMLLPLPDFLFPSQWYVYVAGICSFSDNRLSRSASAEEDQHERERTSAAWARQAAMTARELMFFFSVWSEYRAESEQ